MPEPVKPRRRYESPRRREQAEATRRAILDAAKLRFERDGYVATTMAAITVYTAFETKSGVLRALWHLLLRGDEGERPVGERGWFKEVLDEPDPVQQLRLNARNARRVKSRAGTMLGVIRSAAEVDGDAAALWARIEGDFHANQGAVVGSIAAKGALRPGLGVDRATDVLWTLNHPDVWLLLAGRGWTPEEFEDWFADASCSDLLGLPVSSRAAG
jgi:AcrR family transcriptional regulator